MGFPSRIICLTEESVETLFLLDRQDLIQGVSQYVERPLEAKKLPKVSQFIRSDIQKIVELRPDLVLGFSDIQKEIAKELIGNGLNVFITNQRSIQEILDYILLIGRIVGEEKKAQVLVQKFEASILEMRQKSAKLKYRPKIYFEEWDHPRLSAIGWVGELIDICGGENIFAHKSGPLAKDREVSDAEIVKANPDIIFACWCGKKAKLESFAIREGFSEVNAVKNNFIWELPPEVFLQPGPALFIDGLNQMHSYIQKVISQS